VLPMLSMKPDRTFMDMLALLTLRFPGRTVSRQSDQFQSR